MPRGAAHVHAPGDGGRGLGACAARRVDGAPAAASAAARAATRSMAAASPGMGRHDGDARLAAARRRARASPSAPERPRARRGGTSAASRAPEARDARGARCAGELRHRRRRRRRWRRRRRRRARPRRGRPSRARRRSSVPPTPPACARPTFVIDARRRARRWPPGAAISPGTLMPDLEDGEAVLRLELQDDRRARPRGCSGCPPWRGSAPTDAQERRAELLRRRLAGAAGDGDDARAGFALRARRADAPGDGAPGRERVVHLDDVDGARRRGRPCPARPRRAPPRRRCAAPRNAWPSCVSPAQRDEGAAGRRRRGCRSSRPRATRPAVGAHDATAGRLRDARARRAPRGSQRWASPRSRRPCRARRRASSARRASVRSSNGCFTVPTT